MKILTKLMLASAVIVTSGFASDISGGIEVAGTHNQNENASVAGLIEVKAGGTFNNAAKLTFGEGGGINNAGTFNNATGHLELTAATGANFTGEITGGEVSLSDTTVATLTSMKVVGIIANYAYDSAEKYDAPIVDDGNYITVAYTAGKTEDAAEAECLGKFASESTITTFNGTAENATGYDNRLTFPEILADTALNLTENKLATNHIPTAIKEYVAANGLDVDDAINIQFDGSDNLMFANGGDEKVIEFAGLNNSYFGVASFGDTITKVYANGSNTLPLKLASDMNNITVEISGENTINNEGAEIAIKSMKINSGAKLIVAAGTTLTVGGAI